MAESSSVYPRSAFDHVSGLVYFPRMLDKIRLHTAGRLDPVYHPFLGDGFDGRICRFLHVGYQALRNRVLDGGADEEILEWCFQTGRRPTDEEILWWTKYATKMGWRDEDIGATQRLEKFKEEHGFAGRGDVVTFFDFYEVDEKRRA